MHFNERNRCDITPIGKEKKRLYRNNDQFSFYEKLTYLGVYSKSAKFPILNSRFCLFKINFLSCKERFNETLFWITVKLLNTQDSWKAMVKSHGAKTFIAGFTYFCDHFHTEQKENGWKHNLASLFHPLRFLCISKKFQIHGSRLLWYPR